MRKYVLFTIVLLLGAPAPAEATAAQRLTVNGMTVEIRHEPIPGVTLGRGRTAPLPGGECRLDGVGRAGVALAPELGPATFGGLDLEPAQTCRQEGISVPSGFDGPPNLFFYAPTGWDYPVVPSDVRGTHTVGPDLNDGDTTFFDFAVANNGSSTARPRFYTYLYRAGSPFAGFYTESLPAGYYTYYDDYASMVPSGTWLVAGFTDSTNVVSESLENDNRWSRSFTWRSTGGAQANLVPYTPTGWDYPIVPSDVRGTHTVGPDLNDYDTTFVDNAFINNGNATARPRFYTYLYTDGVPVRGYYIDSLPPGWYGYYEDDELFVPAGSHTLGLFVDSLNVVAESNEGDNRWSRGFSWRHDPATLPNLAYYIPDTSWDFPLVPSNVRGTHHVGPNLNDADSTYVDWCIANLGNAWALPRFYIYTYFDGTPIAGWYVDSLEPRAYLYVEDDANLFPHGMHVLGLVVDSTNTVVETNEGDNRYSRGFNWTHVVTGQPNLTFYTPDSWDYPIVPSNIRGTHTVGPDLNDLDTTFVDFAFQNNGTETARPLFYIYLYEDEEPWAGFYLDSLPAGYYASAEDIEWWFNQGDHVLGMFIDSTNTVAESLENDNRWSRSFHWSHRVGVESGQELAAFGLAAGSNPMRGRGSIQYSVPEPAPVKLAVYDAAGRQVLVLARGMQRPGLHSVALDACQLVPGTYFVVLDAAVGRRVLTLIRL